MTRPDVTAGPIDRKRKPEKTDEPIGSGVGVGVIAGVGVGVETTGDVGAGTGEAGVAGFWPYEPETVKKAIQKKTKIGRIWYTVRAPWL